MSSGPSTQTNLFEDLWRQLWECHQNSLQELEAKVSKLKKDRCLDAQRLEVFYNRNQELKEQNKTLQDAISNLEERLRTRECDRCTILEEKLKNNQDQNLHIISKLKDEKNILEDTNKKLQANLQSEKTTCSESSSESEEGIIPDSPILPSSLPVANKLRKSKIIDKSKHVRYAEQPLPWSAKSLFNGTVDTVKNPGEEQVLVPNTCQLDVSQISKDVNGDVGEAIPETCGFELLDKLPPKSKTTANRQMSSKTPWKHESLLKSSCSARSPGPNSSTDTSPSLLPSVKRFLQDGHSLNTKRKKEDGDAGEILEGAEGKQSQQMNRSAKSVSNLCIKKEALDSKIPNVTSPNSTFKKPHVKMDRDADAAVRKRSPQQDLHTSQIQYNAKHTEDERKVEATWSVDPAAALSLYDSEWRKDEEDQQHQGELADTDCTWVSHSLLQGRGGNKDREEEATGLGQKAADSLDMMFDRTLDGEYKSFIDGKSQNCEDEDNDDEEEGKREDDQDPPENSPCQRKAGRPTYAHVAVIRKKDERRKLKGATCKECEIYYAHLPEEERQKKLSACSRHRFLYIPPNTPENFWEVGFPSTQTCIERGYIREENTPQARMRRRQPFSALFSTKNS